MRVRGDRNVLVARRRPAARRGRARRAGRGAGVGAVRRARRARRGRAGRRLRADRGRPLSASTSSPPARPSPRRCARWSARPPALRRAVRAPGLTGSRRAAAGPREHERSPSSPRRRPRSPRPPSTRCWPSRARTTSWSASARRARRPRAGCSPPTRTSRSALDEADPLLTGAANRALGAARGDLSCSSPTTCCSRPGTRRAAAGRVRPRSGAGRGVSGRGRRAGRRGRARRVVHRPGPDAGAGRAPRARARPRERADRRRRHAGRHAGPRGAAGGRRNRPRLRPDPARDRRPGRCACAPRATPWSAATTPSPTASRSRPRTTRPRWPTATTAARAPTPPPRSRAASIPRRACRSARPGGPLAAPAAAATTAIALAVGGAAELEQAALFLAAAARAFDAGAPVRVHLLLDGTVEPAAVAARLRPVLAAGGRPLAETLAVRIERVADLAAWRAGLDPGVRLVVAAGHERPALAGLTTVAPPALRDLLETVCPMRTHRTHQVLAPWSTGAPVLDPARLAAVRIEPVLRQRRPGLRARLLPRRRGRRHGDPGRAGRPGGGGRARPRPADLARRHAGRRRLRARLSERILPELERLVLGGEPVAERVVRFADAPRFEAARAAGCYGAAPLREALARLAPYRYARRFARGRGVRIDAPDAVGGWLLLRDLATVTVAAACRDPAALAWYGAAPLAGDEPSWTPRSRSSPPDGTAGAPCVLRLDADGPHGSTSSTRSRSTSGSPSTPPPARSGAGSRSRPRRRPRRARCPTSATPRRAARPAGSRSCWAAPTRSRLPDADTDEARALVAALAAEGFDARLAEAVDELGRRRPDPPGRHARRPPRARRGRGRPPGRRPGRRPRPRRGRRRTAAGGAPR